MPRLRIDQRPVEVPPGTTILDAAAALGIEIPTLCFLRGCTPQASCLVCLVKVNHAAKLVPACATVVQEDMEVESETPEVHAFRRSAIELLLGEHAGDCFAPCQNVCPAHMDIPTMMRQISGGDLHAAVVTVKQAIPLPATLGRICPELCEKGCRRHQRDDAVSICSLKRYVGDKDLQSSAPYLPQCAPPTGKTVFIIGAGPAGLTAAWFLRQRGHGVTIFDEHPRAGGALRYAIDEERLPRAILDAEIALVEALGVELRLGTRVASAAQLDDLKGRCDALLLAIGPVDKLRAGELGLDYGAKGLAADRQTMATSRPGIFAAGSARVPSHYAIRAVADGQAVARSIDAWFAGHVDTRVRFSSRLGKLNDSEIDAFFAEVPAAPRGVPHSGEVAGLSDEQALRESARCARCDCGKLDGCRLRRVAAAYQADPNRFRGRRRTYRRQSTHPLVIFESGKCILCGLCVQIAARAAEPLGLTFIGRGFSVDIGIPLSGELNEALQRVARDCADACPTGALTLRDRQTAECRPSDGPVCLSLPQLRS